MQAHRAYFLLTAISFLIQFVIDTVCDFNGEHVGQHVTRKNLAQLDSLELNCYSEIDC